MQGNKHTNTHTHTHTQGNLPESTAGIHQLQDQVQRGLCWILADVLYGYICQLPPDVGSS
jgi:hypothetical protein